jgi:hypothetical protein
VITNELAASLRRMADLLEALPDEQKTFSGSLCVMPDTTTADHIIAALGMAVTEEYSRVDLWAADLPGLTALLNRIRT